jgi:hypothetical protein
MEQLDLFPETLADAVNHPTHYTVGGIETFEYLRAKLTTEELRGYLKGNIIKYLSRANFKRDDCGREDSLKAAWYAHQLERTYD